jgi:hypothetical protein
MGFPEVDDLRGDGGEFALTEDSAAQFRHAVV